MLLYTDIVQAWHNSYLTKLCSNSTILIVASTKFSNLTQRKMLNVSVRLIQQNDVDTDFFFPKQTRALFLFQLHSIHLFLSVSSFYILSPHFCFIYLSPSVCLWRSHSFSSLYEIKMERGKERPKQEREKEAINSGAFDMLIHSVSRFSAVHRLPLHTHAHAYTHTHRKRVRGMRRGQQGCMLSV